MRTGLLLFGSALALSAQGIIETFVGTDWIFPGGSIPAVDAPLGTLRNIVAAPNGDIFIADNVNRMVVKVDVAGILTIFAGNGLLGFSGDGGPATSARLAPEGIARGADGSIYISDNGTRIRVITPDGIIRTIAGTGVRSPGVDGRPALQTSFAAARSIGLDAVGYIYFIDQEDSTVRRFRPDGLVERVAGTGRAGFSGDAGPARNAMLNGPLGIAVDPTGVLYIADAANNRVRRVGLDGVISTVAQDAYPTGVALDSQGTLYIAVTAGSRIRRITRDGADSIVAGNGQEGFGGDGGQARNASFRRPTGVAADALGGFLVADTENLRLRRVAPGGIVSTIAGNGRFRPVPPDTPALVAFLFRPRGIAFTADGSLLVAEHQSFVVRRISVGLVNTFAGSGFIGSNGDGGPAVNARLNFPRALAVDRVGNVYVVESGGIRVRRVAPNGVISLFAGGGVEVGDFTGPATGILFNEPQSVAVDAAARVYIADTRNHRIRRVTPDGTISTFAGSGTGGGFGGDNGPAVAARLADPRGLAFDAAGNLYFSDSQNHRIRRITPGGIISTVAGRGLPAGFAGDDGPATLAALNTPAGIAVDADGNIFFSDQVNNRVRMITRATGIITTIAGSGTGSGFSGDGGLAVAARLFDPTDLALDADGNLYIADAGNDRIRVIRRTIPAFSDPGALRPFSAPSRGMAGEPQILNLSASIAGVPFSVSVQTISGGDWLRASPASGLTPARIEVIADPAALDPGMYEGTVVLRAPVANPPERRVPVRFTVGPPGAQKIEVSAQQISFAFARGAPAETRVLLVSNVGSGSLRFTARATTSSGGAWLSVSPAAGGSSGARPASLSVTADARALAAGTYAGRIDIVNADEGSVLTVPVTLAVTAVEQTMLLSHSGLTFTGVAAGGVVPPRTFGVLNIGRALMSWTATPSTLPEGGSWLRVAPTQGSSAAGATDVPLVEVGVDIRGLAPGEYHGRVRVESPGAANSPQDVSIVLDLRPLSRDPGPAVVPAGLVFTAVSGGPSPGSQEIQVYNLAGGTLEFAATASTFHPEPWLTVAPARAAVNPERPTRIVVQPETRALPPGTHEGAVTLVIPGRGPVAVRVLFVLGPDTAAAAATKTSHVELNGCTPTELLPVDIVLGRGFSVAAAWPATLEVRIADNCGNLVSTGAVVAAFSTGDPVVSLVPLGNGRWGGSWAPRNAPLNQVTLTITAESAGVRGTVQVSGSVLANANPPVVPADGVVSAASGQPRVPLSPGGFISIYGSRLADGLSISPSLPLDQRLGNTVVSLGGRVMPLHYAVDGQINAIVPYGLAVNTVHQLVIRRGASYSVPVSVAVAAAQPAIFTEDGSGRGLGIVLSATGVLAGPGTPVAAGDVVVIYATGLGAVSPGVPAGHAAPAEPLSHTVDKVLVTIGGVPAEVLFAGLTPGSAGLYQVNARVPAGVPSGTAAVILAVAGQESPPVTISLR